VEPECGAKIFGHSGLDDDDDKRGGKNVMTRHEGKSHLQHLDMYGGIILNGI
jgi:hypothetical protein